MYHPNILAILFGCVFLLPRGHTEQSLDCRFITGTLGRVQSKQGPKQMDHAHFPKSVMARAARNEMEPAAPKNENPAASETHSRHAIDSPQW